MVGERTAAKREGRTRHARRSRTRSEPASHPAVAPDAPPNLVSALVLLRSCYMQMYSLNEEVSQLDDTYWRLRVEVVPSEEQGLEFAPALDGQHLLRCYHCTQAGNAPFAAATPDAVRTSVQRLLILLKSVRLPPHALRGVERPVVSTRTYLALAQDKSAAPPASTGPPLSSPFVGPAAAPQPPPAALPTAGNVLATATGALPGLGLGGTNNAASPTSANAAAPVPMDTSQPSTGGAPNSPAHQGAQQQQQPAQPQQQQQQPPEQPQQLQGPGVPVSGGSFTGAGGGGGGGLGSLSLFGEPLLVRCGPQDTLADVVARIQVRASCCWCRCCLRAVVRVRRALPVRAYGAGRAHVRSSRAARKHPASPWAAVPQAKLGLPEEELAKWRFAFCSARGPSEPLAPSDSVGARAARLAPLTATMATADAPYLAMEVSAVRGERAATRAGGGRCLRTRPKPLAAMPRRVAACLPACLANAARGGQEAPARRHAPPHVRAARQDLHMTPHASCSPLPSGGLAAPSSSSSSASLRLLPLQAGLAVC